jgi:hypothetical protein
MNEFLWHEEDAGRGVHIKIVADDDYSSEYALDWSRVGMILIERGQWDLGDERFDPDQATVPCSFCDGTGEDPNRWVIDKGHAFGSTIVAAGSFEAMSYLVENEYGGQHNLYEEHSGMLTRAVCPKCEGEEEINDPVEWAKQTYGATVVLPLRIRENWRPSIYVTDNFDDCDGITFDTTEGRKETGVPTEDIKEALIGELREYSDACEGHVCGYIVADENDEHLDSCWGFVGEWKGEGTYVLDEARASAASCVQERADKADANANYVAMIATD